MRIGIVGTGVSGLVCAHLLDKNHEVTLFEKNNYLGGHTHTHEIVRDHQTYRIDTGFIVYNVRTYPNFINLLNKWGVESLKTSMSFSLTDEDSGLEYSGESLSGLFAQRKNLFSPRFYKLLYEVYKFNQEAKKNIATNDQCLDFSIDDYLRQKEFSNHFKTAYLVPLCAAIWSTEPRRVHSFPARFILQFFYNHGLFEIRDRPEWKVIKGGSNAYISKVLSDFRGEVILNSEVQHIDRRHNKVYVDCGGTAREFDALIMACHSDEALQILGKSATQEEKNILRAIPYKKNHTVLHSDAAVMPRSRRAWASWNYLQSQDDNEVTLTYFMNHLQRLNQDHLFFVSLNKTDEIDPKHMIKELHYSHPHFGPSSAKAQAQWSLISGKDKTFYCGAYWGFGFHEDGVKSAMRVSSQLGAM